ncbi:MAG: hypothetical protein H6730_22105 [Deltaproteobacteria bacterium]|nr:hypothetical protein [Deltaproteobacteria bacterium]
MGLGIEVGSLAGALVHDEEGAAWIRRDLEAVNAALAAAGVPVHREPEVFEGKLLPHLGSFPYSFLHLLRRAFTFTRPGRPPITPAPADFDPATDSLLDEELSLFMDSHLCCHSDAEGYYVPIDFADVIYGEITGGMLGSSQALLRELLAVAPLIGIETSDGTVSVATANALLDDQSHPFSTERMVWGALFANAQASVEHKTAIRFG